jgi:two-component system, NarL family, nitrate/nitrite response regulator NarL
MKILSSMEPGTIRIVIADGQQPFRESLRMMLESDSSLKVVGEAFDALTAVEVTDRLKPDILLFEFDLSQFELNGFHFRQDYFAGVRTLMMFQAFEKNQIVEALRIGAKGVLKKSSPQIVWLESIQKIVAGKYFLGTENVEVLVQALQELPSQRSGVATSPKPYGLTQRELEIVEKIALGFSNKEVGLEFSIRERTVKHHLTNIFNKVGVSSRLELALFARDNHILKGVSQHRSLAAQQS